MVNPNRCGGKKKLDSHAITLERDGEKRLLVNGSEQQGALIRFYFGVDPVDMSDDEFYRTWGQLEFALTFEGKFEKREILPPLRANTGVGHNDFIVVKPVITPDRKEKRQHGRRFKEDGEPAFTLNTQDMHGVMITGVSMERTEEGKNLRKKYESGELDHGYNEHRKPTPRKDGNTNTLDTNQKSQMIYDNTQIRRLTEIECERLQGFPDNWTQFGIYEKMVWLNKKEKTFKIVKGVHKVPKTQRYRQMGNAVTTYWPRMIAERLFN